MYWQFCTVYMWNYRFFVKRFKIFLSLGLSVILWAAWLQNMVYNGGMTILSFLEECIVLGMALNCALHHMWHWPGVQSLDSSLDQDAHEICSTNPDSFREYLSTFSSQHCKKDQNKSNHFKKKNIFRWKSARSDE